MEDLQRMEFPMLLLFFSLSIVVVVVVWCDRTQCVNFFFL